MAICEGCIHNKVCKYGENRSNGMYCTGEKCRQYKPTADMVEVKHGEWLDCVETGTTVAGIKVSGFVGYKCSLCGRYEGKKEPYCNCGAKMDGGKVDG